MKRRVAIAGGGTGGHFYPGYALGRALRDRGWETLFIVRRDDPAAPRLAQEDLAFLEIAARGLPRRPSPALGQFLFDLFSGSRLAYKALRAFRPQCVVGTGGHVSFPAVLAGWRLGVPCLVHESNAQLGLANRACLPFVAEVAMGLPLPPASAWPSKVRYELCGTPVRPEFWKLPAAAEARRALGLDPDKKTILVFGGSQGARGINQRVPPAVLRLLQRRPGVQCLHLSGPADEAAVRERYGGKAVVLPYLQEMHQAYAAADLAVCRAGASTLAELIAARKPAILVPFPSSAAGHQEANAQALASIGAAVRVPESSVETGSMASTIEDLIFSNAPPGARLHEMARRYGLLKLPSPQETLSALVRIVENASEGNQ